MEKIIVAFESEASCKKIADLLRSDGSADCLTVHSGGEVRRLVNKAKANIVVCGYKLADGLCEDLYRDLPETCSMLMVASAAQLEYVNEDIFRIPTPVSKSSLCASVEMLFQMNRRLSKYIRPRRNEEEKALVEEAKKLLMERNGMTEEQAHRYIQKESMDNGTRMVQTARWILNDKF